MAITDTMFFQTDWIRVLPLFFKSCGIMAKELPLLLIWLMILGSATVLPIPVFAGRDTGFVVASVLSVVIIMGGNLPLVWKYRGFTKLLAVWHLPSFGSFVTYALLRLLSDSVGEQVAVGSADAGLLWFSVTAQIISFVLDVNDTYQWYYKPDSSREVMFEVPKFQEEKKNGDQNDAIVGAATDLV